MLNAGLWLIYNAGTNEGALPCPARLCVVAAATCRCKAEMASRSSVRALRTAAAMPLKSAMLGAGNKKESRDRPLHSQVVIFIIL